MTHGEEDVSRQGEHGAAAVEYAVIASAIAAVIVTIVFLIGTQVGELFGSIEGQGWF